MLFGLGLLVTLTSAILLLFVTISAPITNSVSLLHVSLTNGTATQPSAVNFGTFGYCIVNGENMNGTAWCSGQNLGYEPAHQMAMIDNTTFAETAVAAADGMTQTMVLHPIACGFAFYSFVAWGSWTAAAAALVTWILSVVALASDLRTFGIVKHLVNQDGSGSHAQFGSAMWMLVSVVALLAPLALVIFLLCCCCVAGLGFGLGLFWLFGIDEKEDLKLWNPWWFSDGELGIFDSWW